MSKPLSAPAKSTQRDDLALFLEERLTDVEFLVDDGSHPPKVVKAHKMILAVRNEVFEAMFYGNLPEKGQVRITDLHPDGFFTFIKYLYTRKATFVDIQQAVHTRAAAQKYMDSKGMEDCDTFIRKKIHPTNVCIVLDYSVKYGNTANLDGIIDKIVMVLCITLWSSKLTDQLSPIVTYRWYYAERKVVCLSHRGCDDVRTPSFYWLIKKSSE
ncbi:hypothetical protein HPB47_023534 [Ixodes persulcatus]|uniref:Uncharacterized protein n=1 Tax=Ixodes persulcatus TaxID=34615 RepID=A0AC60Q6S7_IXOPE|nr:hypothetical protein HPB47_023534 [Ixodes persulcatus]